MAHSILPRLGDFGDALAEFAFEWRRPRHEVGADSVVDHREAARRECEASTGECCFERCSF